MSVLSPSLSPSWDPPVPWELASTQALCSLVDDSLLQFLPVVPQEASTSAVLWRSAGLFHAQKACPYVLGKPKAQVVRPASLLAGSERLCLACAGGLLPVAVHSVLSPVLLAADELSDPVLPSSLDTFSLVAGALAAPFDRSVVNSVAHGASCLPGMRSLASGVLFDSGTYRGVLEGLLLALSRANVPVLPSSQLERVAAWLLCLRDPALLPLPADQSFSVRRQVALELCRTPTTDPSSAFGRLPDTVSRVLLTRFDEAEDLVTLASASLPPAAVSVPVRVMIPGSFAFNAALAFPSARLSPDLCRPSVSVLAAPAVKAALSLARPTPFSMSLKSLRASH